MINVNDIKKAFDAIVNPAQQGGYSIDMLNIWIRNAYYGLYKQRLGLPEQVDISAGASRIAYARNKKIHTDMTPFRVFKNITLFDYEFIPQASLPTDFYFETGVTFYSIVNVSDTTAQRKLRNCGCKEQDDSTDTLPTYKKFYGTVELVEEDKWASRANSSIIKKAIYCPFNTGWKMYFPEVRPSHIRLEYLKRPNVPKWNYVIMDGVEIYNPVGSIHLEFDEMLITEVVSRMVKEYGQQTDDVMDIQFADQRIKTGE